MDWREYFQGQTGKGFLATADDAGQVNVAVFSRPHVLPDDVFAFGMADRLTYANLQRNPFAAYAFVESGYAGVRLYLEKIGEEDRGPLLEEIRARAERLVGPGAGSQIRRVVFFRLLKHLPLVGV
jgi:hypothetical protein